MICYINIRLVRPVVQRSVSLTLSCLGRAGLTTLFSLALTWVQFISWTQEINAILKL
jgi:hypothetical protein